MRARLLALAILAGSLSVATGPNAGAQGHFYEIDFGRAAIAFWEDHRTERFAFVLAGQGMIWNSDAGGPMFGDVGCAAVGNGRKAAFGCGELSDFSIDNSLATAGAKGAFDTTVFDFKTGKTSRGGKISFAATWKATGDATPRAGGGFGFDGSFVGFGGEAVMARSAFRGLKGGITRSPVGRGTPGLVDAVIVAGLALTVDVHR